MDVGKLLKKVNSLNEYIAVTEEASEKCYKSNIQLNMSNVLALTKIRSFEIEHINKCEQNGIACIIFERMLCLPPSKTWEVLSRQMVNLLQYWLDAVRKHLLKHSAHWWTFLKLLLKFIKEIGHKDSSLPNILVENTSECLLDLATADRPDAMQRYEILHCFNLYSAESSREIRFALKSKLDQYFTKLSAYMCNCGHLPTQYSIMETLLRWLVPRHDRTLRITSATKWFPAKLYSENTVDIFLERPWKNFFQDARDFLNTHNLKDNVVTSVVCSKLSVGNTVIISDTHYKDSWLDVNESTKCISVLLDPKVLDEFGCTTYKSFETLIITEENVTAAKLFRESQLLILSIQTVSPPCVLPSQIKLGDDVACDVTAVVTSHCDVKRLNNALRSILDDKYQLLLDLEKELNQSSLKPPETSSKDKAIIPPLNREMKKTSIQVSVLSSRNRPEEVPKFSHPVEVKRAKHSGWVVRQGQSLSCMSPSTASTSSLAQLPERLAELPQYTFDKKRQSVCATPELSRVTEVSESDNKSTTTLRYPFGVCYMKQTLDNDRKSQSDNESIRRISEFSKRSKVRQLSPVVHEDAPSCLLVATIGSADDSVIHDTVERISRSADFNADTIVDLLVQEALNANLEKDKNSGINTEEQKSTVLIDNYDAIENTPNTESFVNITKTKKSKVVSSTSDESNTGAISDTPNVYVNTRRKIQDVSKRVIINKTHDIEEIEQFFTRYPREADTSDFVISPTLAKKINKSSSETSNDVLDTNSILIGNDLREVEPVDFNKLDVIDCLNNIVDRVCDDFDKCTKYLNKEKRLPAADSDSDFEDNTPLKNIVNTIKNIDAKPKRTTKRNTSPKKIKLKYKKTTMKDKTKTRLNKRTKKLDLETKPKMSTIIEDNAELIELINNVPPDTEQQNDENEKNPGNTTETTTPLLRKKRKLFSPKDEHIDKVRIHSQSEEKEVTETKLNETLKPTCTYKPYKDIEIERQKNIRLPRNRKSRIMETSSPGSKTNTDLFDKVKQSTNNEQVTLAKKSNKLAVYNFSSDSEDDFKAKKTVISIKNSATTPDSETTVLRDGKIVKRNYSSKSNNRSKRNVNRKQKINKKITIEPVHELVDEKMREAKEILNSSLLVQQSKTIVTEPELMLQKAPEMEFINENNDSSKECPKKIKRIKNVRAKTPGSERVAKKNLDIKTDNDDDRTVSPLPGLVVEEAFNIKKADGESPAKMVEKFKEICQNPEKYINESNTTQNLLSDNERINYSPQTIDITDELPLRQLKKKVESKQKTNSTKAKNVKTEHEINIQIDDVSISESVSEQSIATVGITGHGDSEEAPPSPELIAKTLEHRDLGTENLDRSTKDYFDKLREEINDINIPIELNKSGTNKSRNITNKMADKKENNMKSLQSPVVSVERMSLDDIRMWLPSSRNSESDIQSQISNKTIQQDKTVVVKLKSLETVVSKHGNDSEVEQEINAQLNTHLRLANHSPTNSQIFIKGLSSYPCVDPKINSNKTRIIKKTRIQPSRSTKCTPQSIISPIKLFDDLISNVDKLSQTTLSEDEDFISEIKKTKSRTEKTKIRTRNLPEEKSPTEMKFSKQDKTENQLESPPKLIKSSSSVSKISTLTKIDSCRMLKRCLEGDVSSCKKKKTEDNDNIGNFASGSAASASSVNEWLKKDWLNEPGGSRTKSIRISVSDTIESVIEKLDTTLVEIHQSTSTKFVQIFVCAQQQLRELKEKRQSIYKTVAQEILTTMVKVIDEQFASLDKRSQEQDMTFMKQLKEQTSAVIREDCKQKRIMVQLLKEDVEAVLEYERSNK